MPESVLFLGNKKKFGQENKFLLYLIQLPMMGESLLTQADGFCRFTMVKKPFFVLAVFA